MILCVFLLPTEESDSEGGNYSPSLLVFVAPGHSRNELKTIKDQSGVTVTGGVTRCSKNRCFCRFTDADAHPGQKPANQENGDAAGSSVPADVASRCVTLNLQPFRKLN